MIISIICIHGKYFVFISPSICVYCTHTQPLPSAHTHTQTHTHTFAMDNIILKLLPLPGCCFNPVSLKPYTFLMNHSELGCLFFSNLWLAGWKCYLFFLLYIKKVIPQWEAVPNRFCITPPLALYVCRWKGHLYYQKSCQIRARLVEWIFTKKFDLTSV